MECHILAAQSRNNNNNRYQNVSTDIIELHVRGNVSQMTVAVKAQAGTCSHSSWNPLLRVFLCWTRCAAASWQVGIFQDVSIEPKVPDLCDITFICILCGPCVVHSKAYIKWKDSHLCFCLFVCLFSHCNSSYLYLWVFAWCVWLNLYCKLVCMILWYGLHRHVPVTQHGDVSYCLFVFFHTPAHFSKYNLSRLIKWNLNWIVVICTNISNAWKIPLIFHILSTFRTKACSSLRWMTAPCVFQNTVNLLSQRRLVYSFAQEHEYFSVRHVLQITNYSVAALQHCVISSSVMCRIFPRTPLLWSEKHLNATSLRRERLLD